MVESTRAEALISTDPSSPDGVTALADLPDDVLIRALERAFEAAGSPRSILRIRRRLSPAASSFPAEVVRLDLPGGAVCTLFIKDLSWSRRDKGRLDDRRAAELTVYRNVLRDSGLPLATYHGVVWVPPRGPFLLLLEYLDATELRSEPLYLWPLATQWLGQLHAFVASDLCSLGTHAGLFDYDRSYFELVADRAAAHVRVVDPALSVRFTRLLAGYDAVIDAIVRQPTSLVHGDFRPFNLLLPRVDRTHVVPIDWEAAGRGPIYLDLACLTDGFGPPMIDALWGSYRAAAVERGLQVPPVDTIRRNVDALRLHRVLKWLSHSGSRQAPPGKVPALVAQAEILLGGLV